MTTTAPSVHADPPPPIVTEPSGINYATGPALGKGGFAICHRAERYDGSMPTGQVVALKIVKSKMEPAKIAQKFVTELQIHSKLSHPNIVTFHRAFSFQTSTYVVLELCSNGSLADMLKRRKYLTLPEIRRLVIQVCGAVKYLHHRHIVHRDLKTGNLFLDSNMNVKVGDFGLAALVVTEREMEVRRRTTMCGTPNYLAPEILEKGKGHDEKVDLWAIGVIAYTLAVGKAPFHASTKEEIYKKLKSGTYTWPELSATSNQSTDLRNLVSSLLVPEEFRPLPDQIVSHPFFKITFVPPRIPSSARERAPVWPEAALPTVETLRRGYSDTWFAICKESGVGEYEEGRCFPLNNGRKVRSIVHDMAKEVQAGRQPTMPIPKDVVYTSLLSDLCAPADEDKTCLRELSHNEVASTRPHVSARERAMKAGEPMPPPPRPVSRVGRAGTVRKAARTISEEAAAAKNAETIRIATESSNSAEGMPASRTRPISSAAASLRQLHASSSSENQEQTSPTESEPAAGKLQRAPSMKRSADASLARRPRARSTREMEPSSAETGVSAASTVAPRRAGRARPLSAIEAHGPLATMGDLGKTSPFRYKRRAQPANEVIEILSDPESDAVRTGKIHMPPPPVMSRPLPVPRRKTSPISAPTDPAVVPATDPATVLKRLSAFRDNLAAELSRSAARADATNGAHRGMLAEDLPFVSRWVDYSRKHGVGYVLSDGTVGCIINATSKPGQPATPVTHVLVRNGQRWLQKLGNARTGTGKDSFAGIESVPLEIFEDHSSPSSSHSSSVAGIHRRIYKGLGSVESGPHAVDAERRRTLSVLWVKFGRYMCQSLDGSSESQKAAEKLPTDRAEVFVRFYQRISTLGLWAFSDGCMQVHFPDHTKFVISADGRTVSATLLSVDAATHLDQHGELLAQHVNTREVHQARVGELLYEAPRLRQRVVRANQVREKLEFVNRVVEEWVANGGLGRLDEDFARAEEVDATKLIWKGLAVRDSTKKAMDRVTVGRYGGD